VRDLTLYLTSDRLCLVQQKSSSKMAFRRDLAANRFCDRRTVESTAARMTRPLIHLIQWPHRKAQLLFLGNRRPAHHLRPVVTTWSIEHCLAVVAWPRPEDETCGTHQNRDNSSLVVSSPCDARALRVNPCFPIYSPYLLRQSIMKSTGLRWQGALGDRGLGWAPGGESDKENCVGRQGWIFARSLTRSPGEVFGVRSRSRVST
jgi:hypothetical protein